MTTGVAATPSGGTERRRGFGRSSAIYVAGNFLAKASRFLLIPIYVRFLTQAEVGALVFLEAVSIALSRIFTAGLGQAVKRFYVDYQDERQADGMVGTLWWTALAVAAASGGVVAWVGWSWGGLLTTQVSPYHLMLAIASAVLFSTINIPREHAIVREQPGAYTFWTVGQLLAASLVTIWLVVPLRMGLEGALLGQILGYGLWTVVTAAYFTKIAWGRWSGGWGAVRKAFGYGVPLIPHLFFMWGITFVDRLVLERFVPLSEVGVYGVGYQMASAIPVLSLAVLNTWQARYFRSADDPDGPARFSATFTAICSLILLASVTLAAFAPEVIALVATAEYSESALVLGVVSFGLFFHGAYQAFLLPLFFVKASRTISLVTGIGFATNLVANLLTIPRWGIHGAAASTVLAYAVASVISYATAVRLYPFELQVRRLLPVVLGGALAAVLIVLAAQLASPWTSLGARVLIASVFGATVLDRIVGTRAFPLPWKRRP